MINLTDIFYFIISAILVESLVYLFTKSFIFLPIRKLIYKINSEYLNYFLECGYCQSVWVSLCITLIFYLNYSLPLLVNSDILQIIMCTLVTHRISNIIHFINDYMYNVSRSKDNI